MIEFEKCQICYITTNQLIKHRCRRCSKTGLICKSCLRAGGQKRHIATVTQTKANVTWSTGCCVDCNKAEIRDIKLGQLGIL